MHVSRIEVRNFRLLKDVSLVLEEGATLIVGRNNSGKTSLAELFRRLFSERQPAFRLEDFSLATHDAFWEALKLLRAGKSEEQIQGILPAIEVKLTLRYDTDAADLGILSNFIIDLDPTCTEALIVICFSLADGKVATFFEGFDTSDNSTDQNKTSFFRTIKGRISTCYNVSIHAVAPNDPENRKLIEWNALGALVQTGFINAQRGLDDTTHKDRDVLGKILEALFNTAVAGAANAKDRTIAQELAQAVDRIQRDIQDNFNGKLSGLLPAFSLFGYPGLSDPGLITETTLDIERLLSNHTKVRYATINGFSLPETYNGLGTRNLIFILLQLLGFFKAFQARLTAAGVHLIFIEEPEAHLHPQMQEVFIRQVERIAEVFEKELNDSLPWPVQFIISTHSPHMANEARFESIRYFLAAPDRDAGGIRTTRIKDLRHGLGDAPQADRDFLHQYLTQTRCDLFFADKAVLIEGTTERLLLPTMLKKIDAEQPKAPKIASQYLTIMEVGGAYAHKFFKLLDFLELRALIITDIDSVKPSNGKYVACMVSESSRTSNGCLKNWFGQDDIEPSVLVAKSPTEKVRGLRRIAYQVPEQGSVACGRSFEDAFILANGALFGIAGGDVNAEEQAWTIAQGVKKSAFAIEHAIDVTEWRVPLYIAEGLRWLAADDERQEGQAVAVNIEISRDNHGGLQMEVTSAK